MLARKKKPGGRPLRGGLDERLQAAALRDVAAAHGLNYVMFHAGRSVSEEIERKLELAFHAMAPLIWFTLYGFEGGNKIIWINPRHVETVQHVADPTRVGIRMASGDFHQVVETMEDVIARISGGGDLQ